MRVIERVLACAEAARGKPALVFGDEIWSYGRLVEAARAVRDRATDGEGVALLFLPQGPEAVAAYLGLMWAGLTPSFMPLPSAKQDPALYWRSHRALLELIAPVLVLASVEAVEPLRHAAPEGSSVLTLAELLARPVSPDRPAASASAPALLQHSSGTTGLKKGVALSHAAIEAQVDDYAAVLGATEQDVVVSWLPVYHDMGLIACTVMPLMLGQTVVMLDPFRWAAEPAGLFDAITAHRGTLCWLPNFAFEHLVRMVRVDPGRHDLSTVRAVVNCSEPCRAESFDRFEARFASLGVRAEQLQVCYAMAETVFAVSQTPLGRPVRRVEADGRTLLSCGPPLPRARVQVTQAGEIEVGGPYVFEGYHRRPELTAERLREGWCATRDLGFVQDEEVFVRGRLDDLLIVHGRNYYAHEIEAALAGVEGVRPGRAAAFAVDNPLAGSAEAVAVVEHQPDAQPEVRALRRALKAAVLEAMGLELRDVVVVPPGWLVKTTSGKVSRAENRRKYLETLAP